MVWIIGCGVSGMQLIRIKFAKGEELRFLSHLDLMRTVQRIFRRARLPLAYSQGFNPHPKIAYSPALPVGVTSDTEYLDVELAEKLQLREIKKKLVEQSPPGLEIKELVEIKPEARALNVVINRAEYEVRGDINISRDQCAACLEKLLAKREILVKKTTKKGMKEKNIRPGIFNLECAEDQSGPYLKMLVLAGSLGNVRPEQVLEAIDKECALRVDTPRIKRTGLYIFDGERYLSPLAEGC